MELQPESEDGKRLFTVLAGWMEKSPDLVVDELKRMLLMCSLKLKSEDNFITVLYGQKLLEESPSILVNAKTLLEVLKLAELFHNLNFLNGLPEPQISIGLVESAACNGNLLE